MHSAGASMAPQKTAVTYTQWRREVADAANVTAENFFWEPSPRLDQLSGATHIPPIARRMQAGTGGKLRAC